jgi:hypothetical protein
MTKLLVETLRSGTIASVAIMPLGLLFRALDLRIGHYPQLPEPAGARGLRTTHRHFMQQR